MRYSFDFNKQSTKEYAQKSINLSIIQQGIMIFRINRQIEWLSENPLPNFHVTKLINNPGCIKLMGRIISPLGSLYEFKVFEVVADLYQFPSKPPKITFGTKIYNPNIAIQEKIIGSDPICPDIIAQLGDAFVPTKRLRQLFSKIIELLVDPRPRVPCGNPNAIHQFKNHYPAFEKTVEQYCMFYCKDAREFDD